MSENRLHFTNERLARLSCPKGKSQQLYWDDNPKCLGVRVTRNGSKSFIFEFHLNGRNGRLTLGSVNAWSIKQARTRASQLQVAVDSGVDPREQAKRAAEAAKARLLIEKVKNSIVREFWDEYVESNYLHWGERHLADHREMAKVGSSSTDKCRKSAKDGPLRTLLSMKLYDLDAGKIVRWLRIESSSRPTSTAKAYRLFRAFLNWMSSHSEYSHLLRFDLLLTREVKRLVPAVKPKDDCLEIEMLQRWFQAVESLENSTLASFMQALLLTGARKGELLGLTWEDVDFTWKHIVLRDKVEGERRIPLTPHVEQLLRSLPARNKYVFSSADSRTGRLVNVYKAYNKCIEKSELPRITPHGLRRSFSTLSEWVECPVGVTAQIQGHKPSAIAEKHYKKRPLDLLRLWHIRIENFILGQAKQPVLGQDSKVVVLQAHEGVLDCKDYNFAST